MSLRQDFKKHSPRYQIDLENTQKKTRQQYLKTHIKTLERENEVYRDRISVLVGKRMKLREKERELQLKITNNEWRLKDFNK